MIHPTAIVDPSARIGAGVAIGAYSIVGADVEIGDGTSVGPHVVIEGRTRRTMSESSNEAIDKSRGTSTPISCATRRPASAMTSLSNTIAVGRLPCDSRRRISAAAASAL